MSVTQFRKVGDRHQGWEPPTITELKIGTETKSNPDSGYASQSAEPPPPAAPTVKLGFSFEWALPLSRRFEE